MNLALHHGSPFNLLSNKKIMSKNLFSSSPKNHSSPLKSMIHMTSYGLNLYLYLIIIHFT
jgi:hypothetical protein